jgi:hypothetical protein
MRKRKFVFGSKDSPYSRLTEVSDPDKPKPTSSIFVPFNYRPATPPPPPPPGPPPPPPPPLESAPATPSLVSTPAPSDTETTEAYGQSHTSEDSSSVSECEPSPKRHRPQRTPCALRVGFEDQDHVLCVPEAAAESDVEFILEVFPKLAQQITHVRLISGPGSCLCPRHMFSLSAIDMSAVLAKLPRVMSVTTVVPERPLSPQEEHTYDLRLTTTSKLVM